MSASPFAAPSVFDAVLDGCKRHYVALAAVVLCLAALNLTIRLGSEIVTEWDESLYAISAAEMVDSGNWIGTTIHGQLDYYNTKPPLNIWLIALSFKAFGKSLISLRLPSVVSAWLTVLVLMGWARRCFGPAVALLAGVVLATNFGFIYVHAGRSADTDALLALLILLTVVTLWIAEKQPWRLVWLGPLMAAVFLLKGMAVLMPLSIVLVVEAARHRAKPRRWVHLWVALPTFVLPVGLWSVLRWRVDEWQFLKRVVYDDFVGHAFDVLDGQAGNPFFHLNVLQKQEYGWLLVAAMALLLLPMHLYRWRGQLSLRRDAAGLRVLLGVWAGITLLVPTLMRTKLPWYLNPFYPAFALGVAWLLAHGLSHAGSPRRRLALGLAIALVFVAAEGRLAWYSFHYRDLGRSVQGILLTERVRLSGRVVFGPRWENADNFVLGSLIGAEGRVVCDSNEFLHSSAPGDYLVSATDLAHPTLALVRTNGRHWLYRRVELAAQASR